MQVAHRIGAEDFAGARKILRQSVTATLIFSSLLAVTGITISDMLPSWLSGMLIMGVMGALIYWISSFASGERFFLSGFGVVTGFISCE